MPGSPIKVLGSSSFGSRTLTGPNPSHACRSAHSEENQAGTAGSSLDSTAFHQDLTSTLGPKEALVWVTVTLSPRGPLEVQERRSAKTLAGFRALPQPLGWPASEYNHMLMKDPVRLCRNSLPRSLITLLPRN